MKKLSSIIKIWPQLTCALSESGTCLGTFMRVILGSFMFVSVAQIANFPATPVHAQPLGKGVFEHHTYTYSPLISGYPNPTNSTGQAQLDSILNNPNISGIQMSYDWRFLEPTPGTYRWDIIDADIAPWSARGKKVWIEIHTANKRTYQKGPRGFPLWLTQPPYNVPTVGYYHIDAAGVEHTQYPVFWNATYQQRFESFISAFAARYDGHPAIEFIAISGYSAGTEPRLSSEDNSYYYDAWMAAGLDPGLTKERINLSLFYSSSEAATLGVQPVYLNTNKWALDVFTRYFTKTQLMVNVTKWHVEWQEERYLYAVTRGIGLGNNGLTARSDMDYREFAKSIQLTYGVPVGFFEFGPDARIDSGPDYVKGTADDSSIKLIDVYRRGMGIDGSDPLYSPWSRISYAPAGKQQVALETEQEWKDALAWAFGAQHNWTDQGTPDTTPPSTPTNLATTSIASSSIGLSWTPSTDNRAVTGYTILRNGVPITDVFTTVYTDTGLAQATTYSYNVAAFDAAGNTSAQSTALSAQTTAFDSTPPTAPTGLTASQITSTRMTVTWNAATDNIAVAGYKIYRDGMQIATTTARSYSVKGLANNTIYKFTVAAYDGVGNSSTQSPSMKAKTLP